MKKASVILLEITDQRDLGGQSRIRVVPASDIEPVIAIAKKISVSIDRHMIEFATKKNY